MKVPLYNKKLGIVVFQEEAIAKTNLDVAANLYTLEIPEELINLDQFRKECGEQPLKEKTSPESPLLPNTDLKPDATNTDLNKNQSAAGNHNITLENPPVENPPSAKEDDLVPVEKWTVPRLKEYLTLFDVLYDDSELKPALLKKAVEYYENNVKK